MKIAIVGATGLVGSVMLKVLEEARYIPFDKISEIIPVASEKSVGKNLFFNNMPRKIVGITDAIAMKPDIAIFSAGASISLQYAPLFAAAGTFVIDNSSAWRMDENIPLVVPEINASLLNRNTKIIANPNCSTIQLVLALSQLHQHLKIKRLVVSTYQSVSGTGQKAMEQLMNERAGTRTNMVYPHPIDLNLFPHGGTFEANGYTTEETKLLNETRKILGDNSIRVTATVVRVPVTGGHSESVNIEFEKEFEMQWINKLLSSTKGVVVQDDPEKSIYPMPKYAEGRDEVFVGRIRRDESQPNTINIWVVADNLRKGAATNAVQIAAYLMNNELVKS
ncbi:MAG: aspartate-semialdehyde dehydrogenase [Bacteroidales bacterium]|nr:aspartate-semialdehyde dehydrogenase [Bacteroidales bacterium]